MTKQSLLLIIALSTQLILKAQQSETFIPLNFNSLTKKVAASDKEIANPKKNIQPKVWIKRGELMSQNFWVDLEQISGGMPSFQLKLFYKEPLKESKEEINGETFDVMQYERMHYYFLNGGLVKWKRIKSVVENPLDEAYSSYLKAIELDKDNKLSETIREDLIKLNEQYEQLGLNEYYLDNKKDALNAFEKVLEINRLSVMKGRIDTTMIQYSAAISRELGDHKKSIEYYKEFLKIKKVPHTFSLLKEEYLILGDTINAVKTMEEAFAVFPDTSDVIIDLIDLKIKTNKIDEGLAVIDKAISSNPSDSRFFYYKGRLYSRGIKDNWVDKALEAYNKSIELDPQFSYPYFDAGFIHFLVGQEYFKKAGEETNSALREALNKEGTASYNKAIPMFSKAVELNEIDKTKADRIVLRESYDNLKRIYYKLQMMDKYNEVNEKLKNL